MFRPSKHAIWGVHSSKDEEVKNVVYSWLRTEPNTFFPPRGITNLVECWTKCTEKGGRLRRKMTPFGILSNFFHIRVPSCCRYLVVDLSTSQKAHPEAITNTVTVWRNNRRFLQHPIQMHTVIQRAARTRAHIVIPSISRIRTLRFRAKNKKYITQAL